MSPQDGPAEQPLPAESGSPWDGERDEAPAARITHEDFQRAFGEPLANLLDLATWQPGEDLDALYERLTQEVDTAVAQEERIYDGISRAVLPRLSEGAAPPEAGVFQAGVADLERIHRGLLFTGAVEACDGTYQAHETLPLTIGQIGVCLVSYRGDQGSWIQHLYRRDLRVTGLLDPEEEALVMLERRRRRPSTDVPREEIGREDLSRLAQRGLMSYAERAVLLHRATAPWRLGHGTPVPVELLTGGGSLELLDASLPLLRELLLGHRKVIFVPSAPHAAPLLTIGGALRPLEYAIVDTLESRLRAVVAATHDRARRMAMVDFVAEVGPQMVVGVYRASAAAPPYLFYAHRDHCHEAALIALADSTLQEHRGFPLLIDLAHTVCTTTTGADVFVPLVEQAYAAAGAPFRHLRERETRYG
ncbi:MAG: hypothetical protein NVSMB65_06830 [Chloroflexota bacterium]